MNIRAFHADLSTRLSQERPDLLAALGRALALGFVVFTFLAGLIFTVLPMAGMVWRHMLNHIVDPVARWIAAEPVFGQQFTLVVQISALAVLLYLLRNWLMLAFTFVAAEAVKRFAQARAWIDGDGKLAAAPLKLDPEAFIPGSPAHHDAYMKRRARDTAVIGG